MTLALSCAVSLRQNRSEIPLFLGAGSAYGTGRLEEVVETVQKVVRILEKQKEGYDDLLASIRRLTVMVLDNLEAGSRDRTLDQGQKRLLSSTGARLLRLWRIILREGGSPRIIRQSLNSRAPVLL